MKACIFAVVAAIFIALQGVEVFGDNKIGETIGFVMEISGDVLHVVGDPLTPSGYASVLVSVGDAPVYDLKTGHRVRADAITLDSDVRVAYNLGGDEPHSAVVFWLNWSCADAAAFSVFVGESIVISEDSATFLCANEKYRITITADTTIIDPNRGYLSPAEITTGMEFFVWTDMITASFPALVFPEKIVVVQ
ncbi:MAG: hypothetical protein FWF77_02000 [Defluviitaleaceae bacterium]|nr:hypothetical protein [Defluviitaleaceae bacterium]